MTVIKRPVFWILLAFVLGEVIAVLKLKFIIEHSNNLKYFLFDYLINPYINETYNEIKLGFEIKNIVDSIQVLDVLEFDDNLKKTN